MANNILLVIQDGNFLVVCSEIWLMGIRWLASTAFCGSVSSEAPVFRCTDGFLAVLPFLALPLDSNRFFRNSAEQALLNDKIEPHPPREIAFKIFELQLARPES